MATPNIADAVYYSVNELPAKKFLSSHPAACRSVIRAINSNKGILPFAQISYNEDDGSYRVDSRICNGLPCLVAYLIARYPDRVVSL